MMGIPRDHVTPYKRLGECHECGEKFKKGEERTQLKLYDDPWAMKACTVKVHTDNDDGYGSCYDKLTDTGWADFRYFECAKCARMVVRQCLDNGWRSFVKIVDEEECCVRCYQEEKLESGFTAEDFAEHCPGDFFSSSELSSHGWAQACGYSHQHITGAESLAVLREAALRQLKEGFKVLVDYYSMGIGGGEGYVTLYVKA